MYAWIWRLLPFGRPGKIIGSLGLAIATGALLWYVVFPWAEPLLPFDDVQVTEQGGNTSDDPAGVTVTTKPTPGATSVEPSLGEHDLPYSTASDNAPPPTSPSR